MPHGKKETDGTNAVACGFSRSIRWLRCANLRIRMPVCSRRRQTHFLREPFLKGCADSNHYSVYCVSRAPRTINSVGQTLLKNFCHLCGVSANPLVIAIPKPVAANQRC